MILIKKINMKKKKIKKKKKKMILQMTQQLKMKVQ